jgi:hypothetical protein
MGIYFLPNGPMPTTAAQATVTTGNTVKTMLQVKLGASTNQVGKVVEWGISLDGAAASTVKCELLDTGAVKATITEYVAADIINLIDPNAAAVTDDFPFAFGVAGDESGYTGSAEGSITATHVFDVQQLVTGTTFGAQYVKQFPLGREPTFNATNFLRIRVTATAAVNAYCYVIVEV